MGCSSSSDTSAPNKKQATSTTQAPKGPRKVVILGCSGHVGSASVKALAKDDRLSSIDLYAGVRDITKTDKLKSELGSKEIKFVQVDVSKPETLGPALKDVDTVFYVTPGTENRKDLAVSAAKAAVDANARLFICISVVTFDKPNTVFGKQFGALESEVKALCGTKTAWCFLRLPLFIENNFGHMAPIKGVQMIFGPSKPDALLSAVSVADIGQCAANVIFDAEKHKNTAYNICGIAHSQTSLAAAFTAALGKEIKYTMVPYEKAKDSFMSAGYPEWQVDGILELFKMIDAGEYVYPTTDTEMLLGRPPISIEQWVNMVAPAFKSEKE